MALQRKRLCVPDIVKRAFSLPMPLLSKAAPNATAVTGASPRAVAASASVQRGLRHICTHCLTESSLRRICWQCSRPSRPEAGEAEESALEPIQKPLVRRLDDQQALNRQTIEARVRETLCDADFQTLKSSIEADSPHSGADKGSRFRGLHNGSTG